MCIIICYRSFYSVLERESSPPQKYEPEKKKDEKPEKPKFRKPMPPPMDFNQLLKLAEEKKSAPVEVAPKPVVTKPTEGPDRPMTKKQRREYEEEMARRQRRLERMEAEKNGKRRKCLTSVLSIDPLYADIVDQLHIKGLTKHINSIFRLVLSFVCIKVAGHCFSNMNSK